MYPAFGSARGPWPDWCYARTVVSLADRPGWPFGLSDSGSVWFPFHAFSRSRTPWDQGRVSDADHELVSLGVEWHPMSQHAPGDAGELIDQGNGQLVTMHACRGSGQPVAEAEVRPVMGPHQHDICRLNKQHAQISAAPL